MKIAFFEYEGWEKEIFQKKFSAHELFFDERPINDETDFRAARNADILCIFSFSKCDAKVINKFPELKFIATRSTGFDHIDLETCRKRGIQVSNVPTYGENTVAEHTFALILALAKKLVPSIEAVQHGSFSPEGLCGFDLKSKTLGIIGLGHIGKHVARIAHGFEMNILAFDLAKDPDAAKQFGLEYVNLTSLLKKSDIISLHAPYTAKTHHLINAQTIEQMKTGAYLINTARGGLIDTEALIAALATGQIAGAGLDVLEEECNIKEEAQILSKQFPKKCLLVNIANNILIRHPNVIVTPHNAFNSQEALMRIVETTSENIESFLAQKPINLVK